MTLVSEIRQGDCASGSMSSHPRWHKELRQRPALPVVHERYPWLEGRVLYGDCPPRLSELQNVPWGGSDIPDEANPGEASDDVTSDIDLPPVEALPHRTGIVVMVV